MRSLLIHLAIALGLLAATLAGFYLLQQRIVYQYTLGKVSENYVNKGNWNIEKQKVPYVSISEDNLSHWDVIHYKSIRDHGYDLKQGSGEWAYAFFPLFPWIWKATGLSAFGIGILNYLLFAVSLFILGGVFLPKDIKYSKRLVLYTIALVLPGTVIYSIPYTESVFFITFSMACLSLKYNNKWWFAVFFALLAMSRPAVTIILASLICTDIYFLFTRRTYHLKIGAVVTRILPILIGTAVAMYVQFTYSGQWFKFIHIQKAWGDQHFHIPEKISDWSEEGFVMSVFVIFAVAIPVVFYLSHQFIRKFSIRLDFRTKPVNGEEPWKEYLTILSMVYVVAITAFIIFFRGGSLNGLQRYAAATPMFYVLYFSVTPRMSKISVKLRIYLISGLIFFGTIFFATCGYGGHFSFSDAGFYLFAVCLAFLMFYEHLSNRIKYVLFGGIILILMVWKTYLMNMFLSDAWIFT